MALPECLRPLLWDMRLDEVEIRRHRDLIVARVVEYGTDEAVRWLRGAFDVDDIASAIERRRSQISGRSLGPWRLWLGKPEDWCRNHPSRPLKGMSWRH